MGIDQSYVKRITTDGKYSLFIRNAIALAERRNVKQQTPLTTVGDCSIFSYFSNELFISRQLSAYRPTAVGL